MSNVIDFIEQWGRDAQWRHATDAAREAALIEAGVEPSLRAAMLGGDRDLLESLIGARPNICCLINHPDEEESEQFDDEDDEKEDEKKEPGDDEDDE